VIYEQLSFQVDRALTMTPCRLWILCSRKPPTQDLYCDWEVHINYYIIMSSLLPLIHLHYMYTNMSSLLPLIHLHYITLHYMRHITLHVHEYELRKTTVDVSFTNHWLILHSLDQRSILCWPKKANFIT